MPVPEGFELVVAPPPLADYLRLRAESGLTPKSPEQGAAAIAGTWYFVHVREMQTDRVVAMGRIIGDGGWYFHIADIATLPDYQGRGLGRAVMEQLIGHIREVAPANPYITLLADPPGRRLYERLGFVPSDPSMGMRLPN